MIGVLIREVVDFEDDIPELARDLHWADGADPWPALAHEERVRYERLAVAAVDWLASRILAVYQRGHEDGRSEDMPTA